MLGIDAILTVTRRNFTQLTLDDSSNAIGSPRPVRALFFLSSHGLANEVLAIVPSMLRASLDVALVGFPQITTAFGWDLPPSMSGSSRCPCSTDRLICASAANSDTRIDSAISEFERSWCLRECVQAGPSRFAEYPPADT